MPISNDPLASATSALAKGELVGLAVVPELGVAISTLTAQWLLPASTADKIRETVATLDESGPRWVWWDRTAARSLVDLGVPVDRCWDILTVHRLLNGGWRTSIPEVWAALHDLDPQGIPALGQMGLLDTPVTTDDPNVAVTPEGYLQPEWPEGSWAQSLARASQWARLAVETAAAQHELIEQRTDAERCLSTARSESLADFLCAELAAGGLPIDTAEANRIVADAAGPRPKAYSEEDEIRAVRDQDVLQHLSAPQPVNLRNPSEVKSMLRREGLEVETTRAWQLEQLRDVHPIIDALLLWRKDERIATTYGYRWLDDHVRGGRLRGDWSSSDGAAGRMTASAGLHNLPTEMRSAVAANDGYRFVRADLGQVEPRVLAAVSGDAAFIAATQANDLYETVAQQLKVERQVAKLAVLGAMYGATTGESAHVLPKLHKSYPVAMQMLDAAAERGRQRQTVTTTGGRLIRTGYGTSPDGDLDGARSAAESRGRFARNALIQGAAAEFFKVWAVIVRRRARALGAEVVLCLHDELLVHVPEANASEVAAIVDAAVTEAAYYWSPAPEVRFVADVSIIGRWSEAKE